MTVTLTILKENITFFKDHTGVMVAWFLPMRGALQLYDDTEASFKETFPKGSEVLGPEDYHITLAYIDDQLEVSEKVLKGVVRDLSKTFGPFRIQLTGKVKRFEEVEDGSKDAVYIEVKSEAINSFRNAIVRKLGGKVSRPNSFTPHITLAYVPTGKPDSAIAPIREFTVDVVHLAIGEEVQRFPLTGRESKEEKREKGGVGSGHFGHRGRPGKRGGSRPRGSGFVTVFHGTQDEVIESIQKNGIYVGERHFGRPPAVYFVETEKDALLTGEKFLTQHWDSKRSPKEFVSEAGEKNFAIIEVHVPRNIYEGKQEDEEHDADFGTVTAAYITQDFPPEWIRAVRIYAIDEVESPYWDGDSYIRAVWSKPKLAFEWERQKEKDTVIVYVIRLLEPKDEDFVLKQLPIDAKSKENLFIVRRNIFFDDIDTLAEQLFTGEISIGEWQETFKDTMRQYYSSSAAIGKGGWDEMDFADWGRLGPVMKDQYQYLQGFAEHISDNRKTVSLKYIKARSKLYGEGAGFPASLMEAGVVFEALLPYIPRDGSTKCLNRCHCSWINRIVRKEGAWNIVVSTWLLGEADHCKTCIGRDGHTEQNRVHETVVIPEVIGGY